MCSIFDDGLDAFAFNCTGMMELHTVCSQSVREFLSTCRRAVLKLRGENTFPFLSFFLTATSLHPHSPSTALVVLE